MEVKINKEIRGYTEHLFFGLSLRQCIFSVLACIVAVGIYFYLKPIVGLEALSWMCVIGAIPFGALGFIEYHGMKAEQILWAIIKSELLVPKYLIFQSTTLYYECWRKRIRKKKDAHMKKSKIMIK